MDSDSSGFVYRNGELHCDGAPVAALAREYGTPLYVYSAAVLRERLAACREAMAPADGGLVAFSVKSCPTLGVLKVLADAGAGFDVVSEGELRRALAAGAAPGKIVFAGVAKGDDEIRLALEKGILLFNAESAAELENLDRIAGEIGKTADFALRVNPDVDARTHAKTTTGRKENKFGILLGRAEEIVAGLDRLKHVRMVGVDAHIGSPVNRVDAYEASLDKLVDCARRWRARHGRPIEWLDAGGGFGLLYRDERVPSFAEYGKALTAAARAAGCKLIVEPGRSIAGNAGILVAAVRYEKRTDEKRFVIVDAGMNDLARPALYDAYHFCWPLRSDAAPPSRLFAAADPDAVAAYLAQEARDAAAPDSLAPDAAGRLRVDVVGPICESSDWLAKGRRLPELGHSGAAAAGRPGDLLAVFSAGAYGFSMASHYNSRPRAAEVLVDGGRPRLIRRRETFADLWAGEEV